MYMWRIVVSFLVAISFYSVFPSDNYETPCVPQSGIQMRKRYLNVLQCSPRGCQPKILTIQPNGDEPFKILDGNLEDHVRDASHHFDTEYKESLNELRSLLQFVIADGGQVVQDESVANMDVEMVSQEEEPEEQDTHRCAKCQMEFTSLQDYVQHKMTNHKLKVKFAKSESDKRLLLPKLVQKPGRKPRTGDVGENETSPRPKRVHVVPKKLEDTVMNTNILYICDKCKKSFRREAALKRHVEYDHRERDSSDEDAPQQYLHPNSSVDPEPGEDDPDDSSYRDPNAPKRPGRGRPPKYSNADMSVASMAAILTSMAGGGVKPQVVTITDHNAVQIHEDKSVSDTQQWRPFVCQLCDKRFKEEAVLRAHMLTHSDVREFPCPWEGCKYAFKTKGSLKRHLRRHTNERPYKCDLCDRRFTESGALTLHLKARTACTSKADSDLPRYGKRMKLDERELRRHPHGTIQVVTSATPKLTQINVEDSTDEIPGVITQEQYVIIEQIPEETEQSEIMETANQDEGQEVENGEIETTYGDEKQCKVCHLTIDNVETLKTHLKGHMENKSFRCTICNTIVDKKEYLDIHMEYVHPEVRKNQKPVRAVKISEDQSNVKDSEDNDEEEALDAVVVQEAMLQEGAEIDSSVLESLAGPPGQPQTIVLLSSDGEPQVMEIVRLESDDTKEENAAVLIPQQTNEDITEPMIEEGKNNQNVVLMQSKAEESPTTPEEKNENIVKNSDTLERNNAEHDNKHRAAAIALQQLVDLRETVGVGGARTSSSFACKKDHACRVCGRKFRGASYLRLHMRSHTGERPYKCALCPKTFATRDTLSKHQHAHSDERNYECGECGKMFKRISHVREHLKSHNQDRPFVCHICEKGFKTSNACKVHIRTHTDILPYKCDHCSKEFREKGSLERHVRTHTGEKPYKCKHCSRTFAEHGTLNRHLRAKVPCTRQLQQARLRRDETATRGEGSEIDASGATETGLAIPHEEEFPTVLTEFSSVVADTQQYMISSEDVSGGEQNEPEYVMVTSDGQTEEVQRIQIVEEVGEADLAESGQYILLSEENEKIMVHIDGVSNGLPVSCEGSTVVSTDEMDTIQTVEMLPSDAEHIVQLTPASTNEHIEAVAMMPTESEPVEPIDAQIEETVE